MFKLKRLSNKSYDLIEKIDNAQINLFENFKNYISKFPTQIQKLLQILLAC